MKKAAGNDAAKRLDVLFLLRMKSKAGYTHISSSTTDVKKAGRAATNLLEAVQRAWGPNRESGRGPYPESGSPWGKKPCLHLDDIARGHPRLGVDKPLGSPLCIRTIGQHRRPLMIAGRAGA